MARFYVEHNGEWNIFSTIVDDFLLDEFVCIDALKARLLYERYKELTEDIDSLMTDRPRVNVMSYTEATERMRKTEPTCSKMEQVEDDAYFLELMGAVERGEISDAGANQAWYEYINHKDEPQTERSPE